MILGILYFIYVVNCLILIFFVLLQQSKGGGLAGAFGGGGGSDTFFGYTGMQKIGHWTIYSAITFMFLSILIANMPQQAKMDTVVDFSTTSGAAAPASAPADAGAQPAPAPDAGGAAQPAPEGGAAAEGQSQ